MMFGKKNTPVESWADSQMRELTAEWREALDSLWSKSKQTYLKAEALKVYDLTSPDGEAAQNDLNEAKHNLICSIGRYDSAVAAIQHFHTKHHKEMEKNWNTEFRDSHEMIEFAIREIFKGNF